MALALTLTLTLTLSGALSPVASRSRVREYHRHPAPSSTAAMQPHGGRVKDPTALRHASCTSNHGGEGREVGRARIRIRIRVDTEKAEKAMGRNRVEPWPRLGFRYLSPQGPRHSNPRHWRAWGWGRPSICVQTAPPDSRLQCWLGEGPGYIRVRPGSG